MIKEKKCKGQGLALGYGCGKMVNVSNRIYGLGKSCCYANWLMTSENGKIKMDKALNIGKTKVTTKIKKESKEADKITKLQLMSTDKYRATVLQPIINEIARIIDYGQPCVADGTYGKMNGGHYVSVGANRTTALNLHNIHIQSFSSNHFKSGDSIRYKAGLIERYGKDYFEFVEFLQQHKPLNLTKQDLVNITLKASTIRLNLKRDEKTKTAFERIELRNIINLELGIYEQKFCEFYKE